VNIEQNTKQKRVSFFWGVSFSFLLSIAEFCLSSPFLLLHPALHVLPPLFVRSSSLCLLSFATLWHISSSSHLAHQSPSHWSSLAHLRLLCRGEISLQTLRHRRVCVALFYQTDIGDMLCTVPGLHRERAKGDAHTIRDRRRRKLTLSPLK